MKHLQTYRLYENPNSISVDNQDIVWDYGSKIEYKNMETIDSYYDDASVCFSYYFGNIYTITNGAHEDLFYDNEINFMKDDSMSEDEYRKQIEVYNDEYGRGELSGRLFPRYKIITFWYFPKDKKELKKVCDDLFDETGYDVWNENGWKIEITKKDGESWGGWSPSTDDGISQIPVKDYKQSKQRTAEELKQAHVEVGKGGKAAGFGSDYYNGKLPDGMSQAEYRDKKSKYKYTERQEHGFEIKDIDLFNPVEDKKIYKSKLETDFKN